MAVVARTYARALFEAAKDAGRIDEVRDQRQVGDLGADLLQ